MFDDKGDRALGFSRPAEKVGLNVKWQMVDGKTTSVFTFAICHLPLRDALFSILVGFGPVLALGLPPRAPSPERRAPARIPDPGSRIPDPGSRIPDDDPPDVACCAHALQSLPEDTGR